MAPVADLAALLKEAHEHLNLGRTEQADKACQTLLTTAPDHPAALLIQSVVRMTQHRWAEAEELLLRGRAAHPTTVAFHASLGRLYVQQHRLADAIEPVETCVLLDPAVRDHRTTLVALYQTRRFAGFNEKSKRAMIACLADDGLTHSLMNKAWLSLLRLDPQSVDILMLFGCADYESFSARATPGLLTAWHDNEFLNRGLQRFLIADPLIERGLTFARRWFFENQAQADRFLPLLCLLSRYCFFSEYVFATAEDYAALRKHPSTATKVALLGCYEALGDQKNPRRFTSLSTEPPYRDLMRIQIQEPLDEIKLRSGVQALSPIEDAVSRAVQTQYEESPYPRWTTVGGNVSLPNAVTAKARSKKILIAGCGTGREAADAALIFPAARVDAVDLSRASLAYGIRKAHELKLDNLFFMQADILNLAQRGKTFDLIVSSGVLHHMREPLAGLQALMGVLRPGGILKVALYSTIARTDVAEARAWIQKNGFPATIQGLRDFRAAVMALPDDNPVKTGLCNRYDFYSASQCRDLVFHVQEHTFTLPQIADLTRTLGLSVVKVDTVSPVFRKAYHDRFPDDQAAVDLANWDALEHDNPAMFTGMYGLWLCRAPEKDTVDISWISETGRM